MGKAKESFLIRTADVKDAEGILACLSAAFAEYRSQYTAEAFADTVLTRETIWHRMAEMCLFVAEEDALVVGTIGYSTEGSEGHLRGMALLPEWRGTGVAAALLERAEIALRKSGCQRVTLDTTEPLTRAIRFYVRHGFSPTGRAFDFFGMRLFEYAKSLGEARY
jgi:GNAT superfamily N-acetyltransferase